MGQSFKNQLFYIGFDDVILGFFPPNYVDDGKC